MDDYAEPTPESIEAARLTALFERSEFELETGCKVGDDGRIELHDQGGSDGLGGTRESS